VNWLFNHHVGVDLDQYLYNEDQYYDERIHLKMKKFVKVILMKSRKVTLLHKKILKVKM